VIDLPLGVTEDRVVGALDIERALTRGEKAFEPGLLARANRGYLYIDEVNLLEDHIVDLLLDVAQSGENVVEREGLSIRHPARFVLVGSGNPEEGELAPATAGPLRPVGRGHLAQGHRDAGRGDEAPRCLRDALRPLHEDLAPQWTRACVTDPGRPCRAAEGQDAGDGVLHDCAALCLALGSDGLRGELTLLRAGRALAAFEGDTVLKRSHLRRVAPMALSHRLRRDPLDEAGSGARVGRTLAEVLP
jgi:magnesium chelatase subunit I